MALFLPTNYRIQDEPVRLWEVLDEHVDKHTLIDLLPEWGD